jgi:hypothetical protein
VAAMVTMQQYHHLLSTLIDREGQQVKVVRLEEEVVVLLMHMI